MDWKWKYVSIYIYLCMCVYMFTYMYIYTYVYVCIYVRTCIYTCSFWPNQTIQITYIPGQPPYPYAPSITRTPCTKSAWSREILIEIKGWAQFRHTIVCGSLPEHLLIHKIYRNIYKCFYIRERIWWKSCVLLINVPMLSSL